MAIDAILRTKKVAPRQSRSGEKSSGEQPLGGQSASGVQLGHDGRDVGSGQHSRPVRRQRRPFLLVLAVLAIALGGVLGGFLFTTATDTRPVVGLRTDLDRGSVISRDDLVAMQISHDPALQVVPAERIDEVVGSSAIIDLAAGSVLTPSSYGPATVPADGQAVVGVALTAAQMPTQQLVPGARVRIIATPRQQDDPPSEVSGGTSAVVVGARVDTAETGLSVIDVSVPAPQAAALAALVATGRVALVLDEVG